MWYKTLTDLNFKDNMAKAYANIATQSSVPISPQSSAAVN